MSKKDPLPEPPFIPFSRENVGVSRILRCAFDNNIDLNVSVTWPQIVEAYASRYNKELTSKEMKFFFGTNNPNVIIKQRMYEIFVVPPNKWTDPVIEFQLRWPRNVAVTLMVDDF
uniref:Uncharacterized protein n=1 Tax=Panagrolaimus sp. JU765 TaxID=591449 RepID=A0AC34QBK2_9BILA